jgi:hypothetical protein
LFSPRPTGRIFAARSEAASVFDKQNREISDLVAGAGFEPAAFRL